MQFSVKEERLIHVTKNTVNSSLATSNFHLYYVYIGSVITFLSLHLQPPGPYSSLSSITRHGSACNPASNGVSTKLILSNPRGVNPYAYGKRGGGEDAMPGWWLTLGCYVRCGPKASLLSLALLMELPSIKRPSNLFYISLSHLPPFYPLYTQYTQSSSFSLFLHTKIH